MTLYLVPVRKGTELDDSSFLGPFPDTEASRIAQAEMARKYRNFGLDCRVVPWNDEPVTDSEHFKGFRAGVLVSKYGTNRNCAISHQYANVIVVPAEGMALPPHLRQKLPGLHLPAVRRHVVDGYQFATPVLPAPEGSGGYKASGSYIVGSLSEGWGELVGHQFPIPLHDYIDRP